MGEKHLRHLIREYVANYHHERYHQGLDGALIEASSPRAGEGRRIGEVNGRPVVCHSRVGGALNFYERKAA